MYLIAFSHPCLTEPSDGCRIKTINEPQHLKPEGISKELTERIPQKGRNALLFRGLAYSKSVHLELLRHCLHQPNTVKAFKYS